MARKIFIVYLIYTVVVFLSNTYIFKENYSDALIKAVFSGVIFTAVYAFISMRSEKRRLDNEAEAEAQKKKIKKRN